MSRWNSNLNKYWRENQKRHSRLVVYQKGKTSLTLRTTLHVSKRDQIQRRYHSSALDLGPAHPTCHGRNLHFFHVSNRPLSLSLSLSLLISFSHPSAFISFAVSQPITLVKPILHQKNLFKLFIIFFSLFKP